MSKRHSLSNVDMDAKTGVCALCGPVSLKVSGTKRRCMEAVRAEKQKPEYQQYMRDYVRKHKKAPHGLTAQEARELRESRECWICGSTEKLVVDHCHTSGVIRGILCASHNSALGMFKDNPEHLAKAIDYLAGAPWITV